MVAKYKLELKNDILCALHKAKISVYDDSIQALKIFKGIERNTKIMKTQMAIYKKEKMAINTENRNEELIEALVKAAGDAFLSLKETTKEHFYFYVFVFSAGLHPYISAWSYEALEKSIIEQQIPDVEKSWWKWDSSDSPYVVYGYDEFFGEVNALLDKRASELSDDELYGIEWELRINSMEEAMKRLDGSGLFGIGKERERVVINVEQAPPEGDGSEYNRALRLNPSSALLFEYLETCE